MEDGRVVELVKVWRGNWTTGAPQLQARGSEIWAGDSGAIDV